MKRLASQADASLPDLGSPLFVELGVYMLAVISKPPMSTASALAYIISKLRWRLGEHHHHTKDPHYQSDRIG